jgi:UDP-N-acetylglucosamine 2-epimerase (non-hydrolysing)
VAHVEAGLRSGDRTMPEEINRLVTDAIADLLLTPSEDANENLRREGIPDAKIKLVSNIMIDSLVANLEKARHRKTHETFGLAAKNFIYVTLHRPSNVDQKENLIAIMEELNRMSDQFPVIFPIHPRTRKMLSEFGIVVKNNTGLKIVDPIGYHDSLCLAESARLVLTDSGGLQEETTFLQTPCLTLRFNTERPVTVTMGSNRLTSIDRLHSDLHQALNGTPQRGKIPPFWDGKSAERCLQTLLEPQLASAGE